MDEHGKKVIDCIIKRGLVKAESQGLLVWHKDAPAHIHECVAVIAAGILKTLMTEREKVAKEIRTGATITCSECGGALNVTDANINHLDVMAKLAVKPCEVCLENARAGYEPDSDPLDDVPPESERGA